MTVGELIKALRDFDDDLPVVYYDNGELEYTEIDELELDQDIIGNNRLYLW